MAPMDGACAIDAAIELVTAEFMDVSRCGSLGYEGQEKNGSVANFSVA